MLGILCKTAIGRASFHWRLWPTSGLPVRGSFSIFGMTLNNNGITNIKKHLVMGTNLLFVMAMKFEEI